MFEGQPKGLYALALANTGERFGYYTMLAVFILYLQANFGFGGSSEEAAQLLTFPGFVLGIGGIVTFKKSTLPQVLSEVPLSRIVVETDAPYMAPTPHRGKRNESAYVAEVVNKLATIYRITPKEVSDATNCNVKRTFGGKEGPFLNTF